MFVLIKINPVNTINQSWILALRYASRFRYVKVCPLKISCIAFNKNKIDVLPVKLKKPVKKERWFSYFIFHHNKKKFVQQRTAKDIWQNLHEFYLVETTNDPEWNKQTIKKYLVKRIIYYRFY